MRGLQTIEGMLATQSKTGGLQTIEGRNGTHGKTHGEGRSREQREECVAQEKYLEVHTCACRHDCAPSHMEASLPLLPYPPRPPHPVGGGSARRRAPMATRDRGGAPRKGVLAPDPGVHAPPSAMWVTVHSGSNSRPLFGVPRPLHCGTGCPFPETAPRGVFEKNWRTFPDAAAPRGEPDGAPERG